MNSHQQENWPVKANKLAMGHREDFEENIFYTTNNDNNNNNSHHDSFTEPTTESNQPPWGHPIKKVDQIKVTRAYFCNINGVGTSNLSNGFTMIYAHMKQTGSTIGMFAETNVDWKAHKVRELNKQHGRTAFPNAISAFSCHNKGTGNKYQPGTTTTMNGPIALRHLESGNDPTSMGRYSYQSIVGQNNTRIMFIMAYHVCFQTIHSAGIQTPYFQQWHHLRTNGHQVPNPGNKY
jgi:hypothetical protein